MTVAPSQKTIPKNAISDDAYGDASPRAEYERRRACRGEDIRKQLRQENLAGNVRIVSFLGIFVLGFLLKNEGVYFYAGLAAVIVVFFAAVAWHRRVVRALNRAKKAANYYGLALARLDDRWAGVGPDGEDYRRGDHLYAGDIDLFGRGSLFQLLSAARTRMGQDSLAAWLLAPADPTTIRARQAAIEELKSQLDLREELAVLDAPLDEELNPGALLAWATAPRKLTDRIRPVIAIVLALSATASFVGWICQWSSSLYFFGIVFLESILFFTLRSDIKKISRNIDSVLGNLNLLVEVLRILERQKFGSPMLVEMVARLNPEGQASSRRIAKLARLADYWATVHENKFVTPFAYLWMLVVHLAYAIERWRTVHGPLVADWLRAVGEFEALSSLSNFAYEHPAFPFPEILQNGPALDAGELGHPLIPAGKRTTNDIALGAGRQLLLVSGSNMSGKSTLLRTVGLNVALALAGGPVCAAKLRLSPLAIASSMRNVDSLQDGVSAFYAEIKRLRAICDLTAGSLPVLFLLDEILHGTNSHDRRAGAEVVIENLLQNHAIGLITTHDLALAKIADRLDARAANVHFEDQLIDGRLCFDYRLRPGIVPKGNGLILMRLLGFEV